MFLNLPVGREEPNRTGAERTHLFAESQVKQEILMRIFSGVEILHIKSR